MSYTQPTAEEIATHRMDELVHEAKASAAEPIYAWDRKAIDWPDLTSESVVVEVGGYKGRWALQIAERYHPRLFVFEPQPWAAATCKAALGSNAFVQDFALGTMTGPMLMGEWETDGCSLVKDSMEHPVEMIEISRAFRQLTITTIDLMLMNIEGYEYTLLPHMLSKGILPRRLMVQFHTFADPDGMALAHIHAALEARGYRIVWTYGVMLTAWERDE